MAPHRLSIADSPLAFMSAFIHPSWTCSGSVGCSRPTSTQSGTAAIWLDLYQYHALLSAVNVVASANSHVAIRQHSGIPPPAYRIGKLRTRGSSRHPHGRDPGALVLNRLRKRKRAMRL